MSKHLLILVAAAMFLQGCQSESRVPQPLSVPNTEGQAVVEKDRIWVSTKRIPKQVATRSNETEGGGNEDEPAKMFVVLKGTLEENAKRLLQAENIPFVGWEAQNFLIKYSYQIQYSSLEDAFNQLLDGYPVQAQEINDGTRRILFASRRAARKGTL